MKLVQAAKMIEKTFQRLVHWRELQETLNNNVKNLNTHEQLVKKYLSKTKTNQTLKLVLSCLEF